MIIGTEITESLSVLLILYTEELNKKVMQEFLETLSAGRYQDAKKQDPQVLLQILICSSKLEITLIDCQSLCPRRVASNRDYHTRQ